MALGDFILAALPPFGAILVEGINLVDLEYLKLDASRTLKEESWEADKVSDHDVIKDFIALSSSGASGICGLAPTFVSVITSGFAILKELHAWLWPTVIYVLSIMIIVLLVIKLLRGSTCYAIAGRQRIFLGGRISKEGIRRTPKQVASYIVYFTNGLLILLAIVVFTLNERTPCVPTCP